MNRAAAQRAELADAGAHACITGSCLTHRRRVFWQSAERRWVHGDCFPCRQDGAAAWSWLERIAWVKPDANDAPRCQVCHRRDHRPGDMNAGHAYAAAPLAGLVAAFDAEAARMRATMGQQPGQLAGLGQGTLFGQGDLFGDVA